MAQDNRPAVYIENDTVVYRASALGHCLRSLWAARSGMETRPIPKPIRKAMDKGTELESHIINLLYTEYDFTFADGPLRTIELNLGAWNGKTLFVRGVPDEYGCPAVPGIENSMQKHRPIDVKAFSQSLVNKFRSEGFSAFPHYAWQQTVYALGYESESFFMPIYNKDTEQIEEWSLVPYGPMYSRDQIRDRVLEVEEAFDSGGMPSNCPADYACVYPYLHETKDVEQLPGGVEVMVRGRINLSRKIDTLSKARDTLNDAIKQRIAQDVTYRLDGYTITVYANPDKFNTAAAKALLTDAKIDWKTDPEFIVHGQGTKLVITPPKGKK